MFMHRARLFASHSLGESCLVHTRATTTAARAKSRTFVPLRLGTTTTRAFVVLSPTLPNRLQTNKVNKMTTPTEKHTWGNLVVIVVPALSDNFMYLIANDQTKVAAVVDPVEPAKLIEVAKRENFEIKKVLTTHNHWDHAGGNNQIAQLIPGIEIIGGVNDRAEGVTKEVDEGDKIDVGGLSVDVISTPCHTPGQVHVTHRIASKAQTYRAERQERVHYVLFDILMCSHTRALF